MLSRWLEKITVHIAKSYCSQHPMRNVNTMFLFCKRKIEEGFCMVATVLIICYETEICFEQVQKSKTFFPKHQNMVLLISSAVLYNISHKTSRHRIFTFLENHMFDTTVEDNHIHKLMKLISQCYCIIRPHHITRTFPRKHLALQSESNSPG